MPAKDFGTKYLCFKCNCKFYDMKKPDAICPKCGTDQREVQPAKVSEGRKSRLSHAAKVVVPVEPVAEGAAEDDDIEAVAADDEEEAADEEV